ncbi:chaplin [Streptomyces sp. NPDC003832]
MVAAAAATSILSLCGGSALADTSANGAAAESPGVLSGNDVSAPVTVPVNVCGNSVDAGAALNPSFGNGCAGDADTDRADAHGSPFADSGYAREYARGHAGDHGHARDFAREYGTERGRGDGGDRGTGASANGGTQGSPGVGSGNTVQTPAEVPVNVCGNSVDVVGALNPAFGNECGHQETHEDDGGYGDSPEDDGGYGYGDTPPTKPPTTPPTKPPTTPPTKPPTQPPTTPPTTPPPTKPPTTPPTTTPPTTPPTTTPPESWHTPPPGPHGPPPSLPETGSGEGVLAAAGASAALIAAGAVLYRRGRAASRR